MLRIKKLMFRTHNIKKKRNNGSKGSNHPVWPGLAAGATELEKLPQLELLMTPLGAKNNKWFQLVCGTIYAKYTPRYNLIQDYNISSSDGNIIHWKIRFHVRCTYWKYLDNSSDRGRKKNLCTIFCYSRLPKNRSRHQGKDNDILWRQNFQGPLVLLEQKTIQIWKKHCVYLIEKLSTDNEKKMSCFRRLPEKTINQH